MHQTRTEVTLPHGDKNGRTLGHYASEAISEADGQHGVHLKRIEV